MVEELKISVIIPVYQAEGYLDQCVQSVLTQSYRNLQVILVDDGSRDSSGRMCDAYAASDDRVQVIHKENGGLSSARNAGMAAATGDYVLFLDSDDFYNDREAVSRLVTRVRKTSAQVLNFSYVKFFEDTGETRPYFQNAAPMPEALKTRPQQWEYLFRHSLCIASACNKLVARRLLTPELTFREGVFSEDIEWCLKLFRKAESMDFVCENFYCYRQWSGSITHTIDAKKCDDLCRNLLHCFEICQEAEESAREDLYRYLAYQYGTFFMTQAQTEQLPTDAIQALAPYRWILRYHGGNPKLLALRWVTSLLGMEAACKLIRRVLRR